MMSRILSIALLACLTGVTRAQTCGMIQLGIDNQTWVQAQDNNDNGIIVGYQYRDETPGTINAFVWEAGVLRILPTLGGEQHMAHAINNRGAIVGSSQDSNSARHAVVWGRFLNQLGDLTPPVDEAAESEAFDLNNKGYVVGYSRAADGFRHAVLWAFGTIDLNAVLGTQSSVATAINSSDVVVGYGNMPGKPRQAFKYEEGTVMWLGDLGGGSSEANGINNLGHVVGSSLTAAKKRRAFIWKNGIIKGLGTLGGDSSVAHDINLNDQVVGWAEIAGTNVDRIRPVSWRGNKITNIGSLYPGRGGEATAVNIKGQVVGTSNLKQFVVARAWRWKKPCSQ